MEKPLLFFLISLFGIMLFTVLITSVAMFFLRMEIKFMRFRVKNKDKIMDRIITTLKFLALSESLAVFDREIEEMNEGKPDKDKWAVGIYSPFGRKIELAKKYLDDMDDTAYVEVFTHELGHHFSIKEKGDPSEKAANEESFVIFKKYFPNYYLLFFEFHFEALLKREKILSKPERTKLIVKYFFNENIKPGIKHLKTIIR